MASVMRSIVVDLESSIVNLFQAGISSVSDSLIFELEEMSKRLSEYKLKLVSEELSLLSSLLKEKDKQENKLLIVEKIMFITNCIQILKKKISYDELGGY